MGSGRLELGYLEDERIRVLARIDELKSRFTELEQQLQESKQEVLQLTETDCCLPQCEPRLDSSQTPTL